MTAQGQAVQMPPGSLEDDDDKYGGSTSDLAEWLRTTGPPEISRHASPPSKKPSKLIKKSRKEQCASPREVRDLTGFKPTGVVEERKSRDGKTYYHLLPQNDPEMPFSEPASVNASANATARSSTEFTRKTDERMSRKDQFFSGILVGQEQVEHNGKGKRQSRSVDGTETRNNAHRRVTSMYNKAHPLAIDPHAALSSNPVDPTSGPVKPLPTPPNDESGARSKSEKGPGSIVNSDGAVHHDPLKARLSGGERVSNQGVRRTPHEQFTNAIFAPVNRGSDFRSLHAMSSFVPSYLRRGNSTGSQRDIRQSSGVADITASNQAVVPSNATGGRATNYSRPSMSARASFQRERSERVHARKMRDLQRGRHSVDNTGENVSRPSTRGSLPSSRPGSRNMIQDTIEERQSEQTSSANAVLREGQRGQGNDVSLSQLDERGFAYPHIVAQFQTPQPKAQQKGQTTEASNGKHANEEVDMAESIDKAQAQHTNNSPLRPRKVSETLPPLGSASTEASSPHFMTPSDEVPPNLLTSWEEPKPNPSQLGSNQPAMSNGLHEPEPSHANGLRHAHLAPKSPATSFKSNKSGNNATRDSQRQSELVDSYARLQAHVETLERDNQLLEAALMAVLRTSGRLNSCPCGGTSASSREDATSSALEIYKATRLSAQPNSFRFSGAPTES